MKYFTQLNIILSKNQKKTFIYLSIIMLISVFLEILTLNSLFLLLNFFSNPNGIENNNFSFLLKNFDLLDIVILSF